MVVLLLLLLLPWSAADVADLVPLGSGAALACCVLNVDLPAVDQGLLLGAGSAMVSSGACACLEMECPSFYGLCTTQGMGMGSAQQ